VPTTASPQTYYIEWSIIGDTQPPFFTPLLKTKVIVSNIERETITVNHLDRILIGGDSLPVSVELSNPPDVELIFNIDLDYSENWLSVD